MDILKRIVTALSVIVMVAGCAVFVLFHVSATGWKALSIPTGSMRPTMPPGSLVLVHSVPISSLKVGDVITYTNPRNNKTTITHRIVKMYMIGGRVPGFVTKGDANKMTDEPIAAGSVVGEVTWHTPHMGTWLVSSKSWLSIGLLVYMPAILLVVEEIQRLSDYFRELQPYRLREWEIQKQQKHTSATRKYAIGAGLAAVAILVSVAITEQASAAVNSNTVTLASNRISVAISNGGGGGQCSGSTTNNNSINVNTSSSQTATSGNATVSENTNGGSATSSSNSNTSTVTITINNCH